MSEMSEKARAAGKAKAKRLTGAVDASDYGEAPCGFMHTEKKLGNRPISKQNLAVGGRASFKHGGRKSRAVGGMGAAPTGAMASNAGQPLVASVAEPPQNRFSFSGNMSPLLGAAGMKKGGKAKHRDEGGIVNDHDADDMNRGGRTHRKDGGGNWIAGAIKHPGALHKELGVPEGKKIPAKKLKKAEHSSNPIERKRANLAETLKGLHKKADGGVVHEKGAQNPEVSGTRPTGGRIARAEGGKAGKGKMNVNIIIAQRPEHQAIAPHPAAPAPMVPPPGAMPPPPPGGAPMPPAGGPPLPPPGGGNMPPPSMQRPPMGRASGGKVYPDMEYSAAGGCGRLEKIKKYGHS